MLVHFLVIHTRLSFEKIVQKEISFQWFSKMYTTDNSSFALAVGWSSMLIDYRVCEEKSKKPNTLSASENHWKSNCWEQEKKLEIFEIKNLCLLTKCTTFNYLMTHCYTIWGGVWRQVFLRSESGHEFLSGLPPKYQIIAYVVCDDWTDYSFYIKYIHFCIFPNSAKYEGEKSSFTKPQRHFRDLSWLEEIYMQSWENLAALTLMNWSSWNWCCLA